MQRICFGMKLNLCLNTKFFIQIIYFFKKLLDHEMLLLCVALSPVQLKIQAEKLETSAEWTLDQKSRDFILVFHYRASWYGLRKL